MIPDDDIKSGFDANFSPTSFSPSLYAFISFI